MKRAKYQTLIFDIETDGLLDMLTRVHCLAIREYETGETWRFRNAPEIGEDTIEDGLAMLEDCESVVGHNIMDFDLRALKKVFPDFQLRDDCLIEDTLVYVRLLFANQKEKDFDTWRRGKLPGQLIGDQGLEAWGWRLGLHKGDYKKEREAEAKENGITDKDEITMYVWGTWNWKMDNYCVGDIDVNTRLWKSCLSENFPQGPIDFEHECHEIAVLIGDNGWPLDIPKAEALANELRSEAEKLSKEAIKHFGWWFAPDKKVITDVLWDDPDGINRKKKYPKPRKTYGEDHRRAIWAEVTLPKRSTIYKELYSKRTNKKTGEVIKSFNYDKFEDAPLCKTKVKEFNPGSRPMIIDRFTTVYDWEPVDFTDAGSPSVDDTVLRNLIGKVPMAEELAEIFYYMKRLGQVATGANAWLKQVKADGMIHHRLNTGGTVSGRCSHSFPNIAQVPKVKGAKVLLKDGSINPAFLKPDGEPIKQIFNPDGSFKKEFHLEGRAGDHGWECRSLFYVPKGWRLVGCDLSGIELRCLANVAFPYDGGFLVKLILEGDIHTENQNAAGLATRDQAKTFIYALIYGAGDVKIGSIVNPLADEDEQREIGRRLREQFFRKMPGLAQAVKKIQKQAKKGYIYGIDGRKLFVRGKHAAFNLRLQSDGAMIAKRWMLNSIDAFMDAGWKHSWNNEFAFLAFVHDELQVAVREGLEEDAKSMLIKAAADAGKFYDFAMAVDAEAKDGINWAMTH